MSSILNNFNIFVGFPQQFKQNIKLFHVFKETAYCLINTDNSDQNKSCVFGFGPNIYSFLNYNRSNDYKSYVLIQ